MSKIGVIRIDTSDKVDKALYFKILESLLENGWSANLDGNISFMVNDSYDWECLPFKDYPLVISLIGESIDNKQACLIAIRYNDGFTDIELKYLDSKTLGLNMVNDVKKMDLLGVVDFTWYLEKVPTIFSCIQFDSIRCDYI
jgi:hypothetical protein